MSTTESDGDDDERPSPLRPSLLPRQRLALQVILLSVLVLLSLDALRASWTAPRMTIDRLPERQLDFQLDVNSATWAELIQLPGVGPQLGKRIVDDRQTRGPFRKLDDLERVPGIGPKTLQEIAPHLIWPPSASASQPP